MRVRIGVAGLLVGLLGLAWTSSAMAISTVPASPTGYWKLFVSMDYESTGTVTNSMCFPDVNQTEPSTLTAEARETIKVRTARPTIVEVHVHGSGIPIVGEQQFSPSFRAQITSTRKSGLEGSKPRGCYDDSDLTYKPRYDCGTRKELTGLFIGPVGGINRLRGFDVQPQEFPSFENCPLVDAQGKLPYLFEVVLKDKPSRLLSRKIPKLVYKGRRSFKANAKEGDDVSSATGSFSYKVTLVKANPRWR